ncbi:hypothetical protein ILYODFUR_019596 [Ilyodon furcidens]|uniref:Uncharacterized protein n=1 Tax=Ilyodon furcidens TaxID=33524 RepID=A0ABV0TX66_9TELE
MKRTIRALMHGTQQQPQVTIMAAKIAIEIINDMTKPFHLPNISVNHCSNALSIPECSCIVLLRVLNPSKARVTDPSGAVLLGIKVQHISPNMAQTPLFSKPAAT